SGCQRSQTFTLTSTDVNGNTSDPCVVTYTWTADTAGPSFAGCPSSSINLGCNPTRPTCTNVAALGITASDTCSGTIIPVCTPGPVQTNGCHLSQIFTVSATDACLNS